MQGDQIETAINYYQKSLEMEIKVNGDKYKASISQMLTSLSVSRVDKLDKAKEYFDASSHPKYIQEHCL